MFRNNVTTRNHLYSSKWFQSVCIVVLAVFTFNTSNAALAAAQENRRFNATLAMALSYGMNRIAHAKNLKELDVLNLLPPFVTAPIKAALVETERKSKEVCVSWLSKLIHWAGDEQLSDSEAEMFSRIMVDYGFWEGKRVVETCVDRAALVADAVLPDVNLQKIIPKLNSGIVGDNYHIAFDDSPLAFNFSLYGAPQLKIERTNFKMSLVDIVGAMTNVNQWGTLLASLTAAVIKGSEQPKTGLLDLLIPNAYGAPILIPAIIIAILLLAIGIYIGAHLVLDAAKQAVREEYSILYRENLELSDENQKLKLAIVALIQKQVLEQRTEVTVPPGQTDEETSGVEIEKIDPGTFLEYSEDSITQYVELTDEDKAFIPNKKTLVITLIMLMTIVLHEEDSKVAKDHQQRAYDLFDKLQQQKDLPDDVETILEIISRKFSEQTDSAKNLDLKQKWEELHKKVQGEIFRRSLNDNSEKRSF